MSSSIIPSSSLTAAAEFLKNPNLAVGVTGTQGDPSANTLNQAISNILQQNWHTKLTETLQVFNSNLSNFDQSMISSWNNISNAGELLLFDLLGTYGSLVFFNAASLDPDIYPAEIGQVFNQVRSASIAQSQLPTGVVLDQGFQTALGQIERFVTLNFGVDVGAGENLATDVNVIRFSQIIGFAQAYVDLQNRFIDAANAYSDSSVIFNGIAGWASGGIADINEDFENFGQDLINTGQLIDFDNLENYGNPGLLLGKLLDNQLAGVVLAQLEENNVDIQEVIIKRENSPAVQLKRIYKSFENVTGLDLDLVKRKLQIKINNIDSLADLLDTKKIFPNSFFTFKSPIISTNKFVNIYVNQTGSVNPQFLNIVSKLSQVVPDDIAISSAAMSASFNQLTGVFSTNAVELGNTITKLENFSSLGEITQQETLLADDVKDIWLNTQIPFPIGSGANGRLTVFDVIGSVIGAGISPVLQKNQLLLQQAEQSGLLDEWVADGSPTSSSTGYYKVLQYFAQGEYGPVPFETEEQTDPETGDTIIVVISWILQIPAGVKGEGTWIRSTAQLTRQAAWQEGIIPALVNGLRSITSRNAGLVTEIANNTNEWQSQIIREQVNQVLLFDTILIDNFLDIANVGKDEALNFALQLEKFGADDSSEIKQILEGVANRNTRAGQAIISTMRESKNKKLLTNTGIVAQAVNDPTVVI